MSLKVIGKLLIGIGLLLLVYGLMMETSVSTDYGNRVVNIGLANDRLMYILIGGFIFVGGVILYGVFKAKQTKEDEYNELVERESLRIKRKVKVLEASESIFESVKTIYSPFAKDFVFQRLGHALGIAFLVTFIARNSLYVPSLFIWLFYATMIAFIFRPLDHYKAISQGWLLASILSPIIVIVAIIRAVISWGMSFSGYNLAIIIGLLIVPAVIFYLVSKKFSSKASLKEKMINYNGKK